MTDPRRLTGTQHTEHCGGSLGTEDTCCRPRPPVTQVSPLSAAGYDYCPGRPFYGSGTIRYPRRTP